jgi:hypothetical protein
VSRFDEIVRPRIEAMLEPGEQLQVLRPATQQSTFKGRMVALVLTDRRLIVQPLDRSSEPDGEPISLPPERIASADAGGAGGGWPQLSAAVMDQLAVTLKLRTTDGEKLKLMLMR